MLDTLINLFFDLTPIQQVGVVVALIISSSLIITRW